MSQTSLAELLSLASPPVAIAFVDAAPPGVPHVSAVEPAGCGYWRRAAAGEVFFTVADDHKRCAVGAHTHNTTAMSRLRMVVASCTRGPRRSLSSRG